MPIQTLPTPLIHRIAAGEVIDSLTAVVRELVENSLDAGATRMTVQVWPETWSVRVTDNGWGMGLADLQRAARPHSTSKIQDDDDLWHITSLGFRGEALHSLAQLAHLEICSRTADSAEGYRLHYTHEGDPQDTIPVAIAPGTLVTVRQLFAAWPARRQALPTAAQQLRAIQLTLQQLALCHPHVTWRAEQTDKFWFTLWPTDSAQALLPQILRGVTPGDLRTHTTASPYPLSLTLGLPDRCHRRRPDWVKIAVNGRCVHLSDLEQTILAATRRMLPRDRFPVCFLHLHPAPEQVDWNRHPAKAEIYLRDLEQWQTQVQEAIAAALQLGPETAQWAGQTQRLQQVLKAAEQQSGYLTSNAIAPEAPTTPLSLSPTGLPTGLLALKAIAQVHNTYIVAEHPSGLWLIEQHIAHERVLFEQICERWECQSLEPPLIVNGLSEAQREQLDRISILVEPFGDRLWAVRSAPMLLAAREDCAAAIVELSQGGDLQTAQVATACRSAIRNGTPLSLVEMQTLVDQWQQTRNPHTCPHGRPIYMSLEETSLAKFFRRHWVIGKSHGI